MDFAITAKWTGWALVVMSIGLILLSYAPGQGAPGGGPAIPVSTVSTTTVPAAQTKAALERLNRSARFVRYGAVGGVAAGGLLVWVAMIMEKKHFEKMKAQFQQNPRWRRSRGVSQTPGDGGDSTTENPPAGDLGPGTGKSTSSG